MNTKKIIKWIIITFLLIVCILATIVFLNRKKTKPTFEKVKENQTEETNQIQEVKDEKDFYTVTKIINTYLDRINKAKYKMKDGSSYANNDDVKEGIYNQLSEKYKEKYNITVENLYQYIYDLNDKYTFIPFEMNKVEGLGIDNYIVYGESVYVGSESFEPIEMYMIVNIDNSNKTFSIEQIDEDDFYNTEPEELDEIEKNKDNEFENKDITENYIIIQKFNNIKILNMSDPAIVYERFLDEEYKNARFPTKDDYIYYLQISSDRFKTTQAEKFSFKKDGDKTTYIISDKNDVFYEMTQTKPSDLKIKYDSYTVVDSDKINSYESLKPERKVQSNIAKWIDMINNRDYIAAYNVLDKTFRETNYGSVEKFADYMKQNLSGYYQASDLGTYESFSEQGNNTYIQKIKIKVKDYNFYYTGNIIMRLEEKTDFVMSFAFEIIDYD